MTHSSTPSDGDLMRRARRDPQAFDEIYVRHARAIHAWLARSVGRDTAWELTAEVFAQAWLSRRRFRPDERGSAGPWLHGIARNLQRQCLRGERVESSAMRRLGMSVQPHAPGVEDDTVDRLLIEQLGPDLAESLDKLPADQRRAIELRVVQELPYDEIARQLDVSADVVRMRVMRGLRALKAALEGRFA
ncbi:MAG: polymerase, sigma-24 subunit, subfamily [Thermoleophilia bacterium]|nr:polymerase, sigma-24 subunit, subfamily [Thermoleophilia bacterium]